MVSSGAESEPRMSTTDEHRGLLLDLEPEVGRLLERHLQVAREWFPHDYVPYRLGRDFEGDPWTPDQPRLTGVAQIAFEVNLLTEDNLPSYHRVIYSLFGSGDGAWINWVGRWTAEEGRHAIVLRDYLIVTRNIDPIALERGRMLQLEQGYDRDGVDPLRGLAYVAFQEVATRIAHRNTGRYSDDPVADRIMLRIAADENLHSVFYRDILSAALDREPSERDPRHRGRGAGVRHARNPHPGLPAQGGPDGACRHLRPADPPRRGALAAVATLARVRSRRPRRRRRGGARPAGGLPRTARRVGPALRGATLNRAGGDRLARHHPHACPRAKSGRRGIRRC